MTFEPKGGNSFGANVKHELMEFRARIEALEAQLETLNAGGAATGTSTGEEGATGVTEPTATGGGSPAAKAEEIGKATDNIKAYTESVVDATYLIREASIAMRGYGMLLDQFGLSHEQKQAVHEMEEFMMMIHKLIQAVHLLEAANVAFEAGQGPLGMLEIALAGGVLAGSMAYGSKVIGGL